MNVGYIRVSSTDQNEERQKVALAPFNIDKYYIEKISAKNTNRPKLQEMLDFCRDGDTIYIQDFSRLARNVQDLLQLIDFFAKKNVQLISTKEQLDTASPAGKLMLTIMGAINEFERTMILERQKEGIAIAKSKGVYKGSKPVVIDPKLWEIHHQRYLSREISKTELAKILKISRPTLYKLLATTT